jgi:hypothetical protein
MSCDQSSKANVAMRRKWHDYAARTMRTSQEAVNANWIKLADDIWITVFAAFWVLSLVDAGSNQFRRKEIWQSPFSPIGEATSARHGCRRKTLLHVS